MNIYIIQKAQQALEELVKDGDWETRLKYAYSHFILVIDEHHLMDAPKPVKEALEKLKKAAHEGSLFAQAEAMRQAILEVFFWYGKLDDSGSPFPPLAGERR